ncbi:MAG: glycosyltransferase [Tranquillimonas sp.]
MAGRPAPPPPNGYRTRMGRGGRFAGRQRQRIALARALLGDAEPLILDEATRALDRPSERLVPGALEQARGRRTAARPGGRYVREPLAGFDLARNRTLRAAQGDVVAFPDDDATVCPGWTRALRDC